MGFGKWSASLACDCTHTGVVNLQRDHLRLLETSLENIAEQRKKLIYDLEDNGASIMHLPLFRGVAIQIQRESK